MKPFLNPCPGIAKNVHNYIVIAILTERALRYDFSYLFSVIGFAFVSPPNDRKLMENAAFRTDIPGQGRTGEIPIVLGRHTQPPCGGVR